MQKKVLSALFISLLAHSLLFSQTRTLEGKITEHQTETELPGIYVFVENTEVGTRTDGHGYFKLTNVPENASSLIISGAGFKTIEFELKGDSYINITMEENILDLPQLVIESQSLSLGRMGIQEIPGSAAYVSAAELSRFSYTNVNDVLKQIPGVNIQEEDGFGLRPNIGLRGSGLERSARVTIMEDGILAAPAPYSSPSAYYFPTMGRMNSVEVLKGSSQIRFGPFTTGGAINFLSTPIPNRFSSKIQLLGGSYGYRNAHAYVGNSYERFGFLVESFQYNADGFKTLPNEQPTGFDKKDYQVKLRVNTSPEKSIYQSLSFAAGQTHELSNETYLGLTRTDFEADPYQRYAASQMDNMDAEQRRLSAQHYVEIPGWFNVLTTVYRNDFQRNWYKLQSIENGPSVGSVLADPSTDLRAYDILRGISDSDTLSLWNRANNREYYSQGIQSVFDIEFATGAIEHDIHLSGRWHQDQEDRFQWEDGYAINQGVMKLVTPGVPGTQANRIETADAFAGYVFYKLHYNRWTLTPGLRYENVTVSRRDYGRDDTETTGTNLSTRSNSFDAWLPGVGLHYLMSNSINLFTGVHRGFSPAGSSSDSDPEFSTSYELGLRKKGRLQSEVVLFVNNYDNLLGRDLASSGGIGTGDAFNAGTAITRGIELQLGMDLLSKNQKGLAAPISLSYTLTDAYFTSDFEADFEEWETVSRGDELPYVAKNQFFLSAGLQNQFGSIFMTTKYQSDIRTAPGKGDIPTNQLIEGFMTMDLSLNFHLNQYVTFTGTVGNLLGNEYMVAARPLGFRPGSPRMINLGVKASF